MWCWRSRSHLRWAVVCAVVCLGRPERQISTLPANGCQDDRLPAGEHKVMLNVHAANGEIQLRTIFVHVPEGMPVERGQPALVSWHGCGSNVGPPWPDFQVGTELNEATAARMWYNIYPMGTAREGGTSLGFNAGPGLSTCQTDPTTDDVAFARAIFEWMPKHLCVDTSRIFAMGFSNGGAMTYRLQCELAEKLRAISVTGMRLARAWAPGSDLCSPTRRIPIVSFCGDQDSICEGATETGFSQQELMAYTARDQACTTAVYDTLTTSTSTCVAQSGCGGAQLDTIEFCSIRGLGHTWPGSTCCTDRCLGEPCEPAAGDVPASTHMLEFFSRLPPAEAATNDGMYEYRGEAGDEAHRSATNSTKQ